MGTDEAASATTIDALTLLELPNLDALTTEQVRGAVCIWDRKEPPLTAATAVDLGERRHKRLDGRYSTFPRACHRHAHEAAYKALIAHTASCGQCVEDSTQCETGRALLRLMRENRR